jgi:uncharacterized protein (DUF1501 family)
VHPDLTEVKTLFDARKLAFLANVGLLTQPTSKVDYAAGRRPDNLFSHSDQQSEWQTSFATGHLAHGMGRRLADATASAYAAELPCDHLDGRRDALRDGAATSPVDDPTSGSFGSSGSAAATPPRRVSRRSTSCSTSIAATRSSPRLPTSRSGRSRSRGSSIRSSPARALR